MGKFQYGVIRKISNKPYLEQHRFKIGGRNTSYSFIDILKEYVMLRMLANIASGICCTAANMFGKASTTDKIIQRYCNGLGGLLYDFETLVFDIAEKYDVRFTGENTASEQAIKIVEQAILDAEKEAVKILHIEEKEDEDNQAL